MSVAALLLLTACSGAPQLHPGEKYTSPFGRFSCGPYRHAFDVQASFGPHGGTVHIGDEGGMTRIDVQAFDPKLDASAFEAKRDMLYLSYLTREVLPLVRQGVPDASIAEARPAVIDGRRVLESVILMPSASSATSNGKPVGSMRGQVHYANGDYIYTVSVITVAWPQSSPKDNIEKALAMAQGEFKNCTFP